MFDLFEGGYTSTPENKNRKKDAGFYRQPYPCGIEKERNGLPQRWVLTSPKEERSTLKKDQDKKRGTSKGGQARLEKT